VSWTERTELLLGREGMDILRGSRVAVVGVGGVGSAAAEMLARASIGSLLLIDSDCFAGSNINRQIPALHSTLGLAKVEVLRSRLLDINPDLKVDTIKDYVNEDYLRDLDPGRLDCVVDAIDTLSPKISLIQYCLSRKIALVSSMGSGAKMDATAVRIDDISRTRECPLARMLRKRLHKLGIETGFKAVYSAEKPVSGATVLEPSENKKSQVGSISYLPTVFGCACAQAVIEELLARKR